jgi:hypothetical protein
MTSEQRKYLEQELAACSIWKFEEVNTPKLAMPAEVKRAKRLLKSWEARQYRVHHALQRRHERMCAKVREAIFSDKPQLALRLIKDLRKRCGE